MSDILIIGGGHNGLVCAAYLAKAGKKVRVLEARHIVGGAAVTEEFHPGFRNSTASYTVSLLNPKVIRDLNLVAHGLEVRERPFSNFLPLSDQAGDYIKVGGGLEATQAEVARYSKRDAQQLPAYYTMLDQVADVLKALLLVTPPNIGGSFLGELPSAWKSMQAFKRLDMSARRDVLDLFTLSAADLLERWFESEPIKAAFGFDAVVGNFASPYTPGSAYVLLHHVFGEVNGKPGIWGHAVGGMGAITQAMAKECAARGVEITLNAPVARVLVDGEGPNARANGVELAGGEKIYAKQIVSNLNPKLLFTKLVAPEAIGSELQSRFNNYQCESATFRMNVALSELPNFTALPTAQASPLHSSGIIMAPSLAFMDAAYTTAREHGWSAKPIVEILIPSTVDDTLAPAGQHVASLFCQHFRYQLPNGKTWAGENNREREQAADAIIDMVNHYAPNFKANVIARQIHSPLDLERKFGLVGGDIFHGKLGLNQLFSNRPLMGYGNYTTPIKGLFMCGSGTHPGGGVTGVPGHNAARAILAA
jgi:phytoene dehydrogenase-like protein